MRGILTIRILFLSIRILFLSIRIFPVNVVSFSNHEAANYACAYMYSE